MMASFPVTACFICGKSQTQMSLKRKRKKLERDDKFVLLNGTHGILLKLLLSIRRKEEESGRDSSVFSDDLFVELQKVGTMIHPNPIQFCGRCDQMAKHVRKLYLELEVLQMKIVDELKRTSELVVTRNLETMNYDIKTTQSEQENDSFRTIIKRFQSFVKENDMNAERIPLVYLGSRLPKFIPAQQVNLLQAQGVMISGEDPMIKQEIPEVDNHADDAYDSEGVFDKNDDNNVKLETPNEIVRKGSNRKRRLLTRPPPIKMESSPMTGRRSAAMRASTLITIATTRQPPRHPKRSKIRTEAQLLAHKIQQEARKIRTEKRKLGILRPRKKGYRQEKEKRCCQSCGFEVISMYSFEQHLRSHEDADKEKPFECPDCKQSFVQKQYFEYHLTLHTNVRRVKCDICEELFFPVDIKEHHLTLHGKAYPCEYCTHCFGSVISLAVHCSNHSTSNMTCEECSPPKVIRGNRAFLRHLAEVHDHKDLLISCEYPNCSEKYLVAERALHLGTHDRGFICQHCGKTSVTKADYNKHIMSVHEKDRCTQICDLCGERFPQKALLEVHKVSKHNFPSKIKCDLCPGKHFIDKRSLVKHNLRKHTPKSEWPFGCPIEGCRTRCITKDTLATHLQHHGSERPFKCDVCGHNTKTRNLLRKHAQVHTDVKKHACPDCGRRFREKFQLTDHIRLHTGERPFLCAVCGASFKQRGQLYHHKRKHESDNSSFPSPRQSTNISGEAGSGIVTSKEMTE